MPTENSDIENRLRRHYTSMATHRLPEAASATGWKGRAGVIAVGMGVIAIGLVGWSRMGQQNPVTVTASTEDGNMAEADNPTTVVPVENESEAAELAPTIETRNLGDVPLIDASSFAELVDGDYPALAHGPAVIDDPKGLSVEDAITWAKESGFEYIVVRSEAEVIDDALSPYRVILNDHNGIVESAEVG